jgi:thiol-disulfide isomerase/thioredoxin
MTRSLLARSSFVARAFLVAFVAAFALACTRADEDKPLPAKADPATGSATPAPAGKVEVVHADRGDVAQLVKARVDSATKDGRQVLVYIGAKWCEPCQRFHRAVEQGKLDATFPKLTLLEFDLDADGKRLELAGYTTTYIPYFGVPNADGHASGRGISGSIKGEGAVDEITPRLQQLLAGN